MLKTIKLLAIAAVVAGSASTAFAATLPAQDQTGWFIDSGRYIDGQTPSVPYYDHQNHAQSLVEGRNSAVVGDPSANSSPTSREFMVEETGN
jgi:hypothetical protein